MLLLFNLLINVDVRHLLCVWHIANDVEHMVDKLHGGKRNQQGSLAVLRSLNLKTDGNRLWLLGRLGIEGSFDIWMEHGFHTKRNLCVHGRMTVYTWVTRLPAELKDNTHLSSTIFATVIAHLIPCLKGHTHK